MKRLLLPMVLCSFVLVANLSAQIKVNSSGYVGINNTNPTYRLDVAGTVKMAYNSKTILFDGSAFFANVGYPTLGTSGSPWYQFYAAQAYLYQDPIIISDINLKKNITNITSVKDLCQPVEITVMQGQLIKPTMMYLQGYHNKPPLRMDQAGLKPRQNQGWSVNMATLPGQSIRYRDFHK